MIDVELKIKVENFAEIVRRYCIWAESSFDEIEVEMQTAQKILAELNYFVLDLLDDDSGGSEDDNKFPRSKLTRF